MYSVLLVDDEPYALEGLQLLIDWEKHGFRVAGVCSDGEEASRLIKHSPPDLVVTDIRMPVMDGLQLISQTRLDGNGRTKFVVMSGYNDFEYARRALQLGVSHYLSKPIISGEADEVLDKLHAALDEAGQLQLVRDYADRYVLEHALSVLVYGETPEMEDMQVLNRLANEAHEWLYIHIEVNESDLLSAVEAAKGANAAWGVSHLINHDRHSFGLVCGLRPCDSTVGKEAADTLYTRIQPAVEGPISMTVGKAEPELCHISESYRSAMQAREFRFFNRNPKLVYYEDLKEQTLGFSAVLWGYADRIVEAIEASNDREISEQVEATFQHAESTLTMPSLVCAFTMHVMQQCSGLMKDLGGDGHLLMERCGRLALEISGKPLQDIKAALLSFCRVCGEELAVLHSKQTGGTLAKVEDYLQLNFRTSLTVKEIAEQFYMNPVYLGQAFSKKYGVGIPDFIHLLRMEEAKELLRNNELTGSAIAEQLGYCSYQHYLKQFEKRVGMKPAEYKKGIAATLN